MFRKKSLFSVIIYAALSYAENDNKTDRKMYVGGINCSKQNAYAEMIAVQRRFGLRGKAVGYHGIQSFREGEVTSEQAFETGKATARQMWGDRYQVLVTVHLNTDNVHCHFVVNPVSFKDGTKFQNKIGDHKELRKVSDEISDTTNRGAFSGLITCACCGKHFRRRVANACSKYAKPAWLCSTFATKGKKYCNNRQIPETVLISKTQEILRLPSLEDIKLRDYIAQIVCDNDYSIVFVTTSGEEIKTVWQTSSRKDSWTAEMKQQARTKTLERSNQNE